MPPIRWALPASGAVEFGDARRGVRGRAVRTQPLARLQVEREPPVEGERVRARQVQLVGVERLVVVREGLLGEREVEDPSARRGALIQPGVDEVDR
jgi:hypothetical protein